MNEHLRKLYLMATRNSDFVTQRNISKYLPMKNDLVNYEGILELNKNLAEVQIAFKLPPKKNENRQKSLSKNYPNKIMYNSSQRTKSKSDLTAPSLLEAYQSNQMAKKSKPKKQSNKIKSSSNITIIDNELDDEAEILDQTSKIKIKKSPKQKTIKSHNQNSSRFQLHESELDAYIDQYLYQLMEQNNVNIRTQIESDRKLFIEKAIQKLKQKITLQKSQEKQRFLAQSLQNNHCKQQRQKIVSQNPQKNSLEKQEESVRQKLVSEHKKTKQKQKSKSTQLIAVSECKQKQKDKRQERMLPSLKNKAPPSLAPIAHRSIYNSTPANSFITKIGRTFYLNELNVLNKTLELEAKNRQRAHRFFRRKLMNIERQHDKLVNAQCEEG